MPCTNPGRARLHAQQRGGVAGGRGQQVGAVARRAQRAAQPPELLRRPPEPSLQHAPQHRVRPNHTYVIAMAPRAPQLRMRHVRRGTCTLQHHRFCRARRRACISQAPDKAFAAPGPLGRLAPCTPTPGCAGGGGGGGGARACVSSTMISRWRASVCDRESPAPLSALPISSFTSDSRPSSSSISLPLAAASCNPIRVSV